MEKKAGAEVFPEQRAGFFFPHQDSTKGKEEAPALPKAEAKRRPEG